MSGAKIHAIRCRERTTPLDAVVDVPGSKSITNRALLLAALASGVSQLEGVLDSDDTRYMVEALQSLGFDVTWDRVAATVRLEGSPGARGTGRREVFVGNAGTAARFLTAALSLWEGEYRLDGVPRMHERPIGPLLKALRSLGADVVGEAREDCIPLRIRGGRLKGGAVTLPGDISSQYVTALLLVAPRLESGLDLRVTGTLVSRPYVEMTIEMMERFGARVTRHGDDRFVVAPGGYVGGRYQVEPDASGASYFFAAAAVVGGRVRVAGLTRGAMQGDLRLVELLERMGCAVEFGDNWTEVRGPTAGCLDGIEVDMRDCSDVAQTLAVVAAFASSPTRVTGIGFIRHKETDRVAATVTELQRLGVDAREEADGFLVVPSTPLSGRGPVETYEDHRMAMSFAVAGLRLDGLTLLDPGCVSKTFPDFFQRWRAMGAEIDERPEVLGEPDRGPDRGSAS